MSRLKTLLMAFTACLAVPCCADPVSDSDPFKPLYQCSQRVWPGAPLHDLSAILVNAADRSAVVAQDPKTAGDRLPPPTPGEISAMIERGARFFDSQIAGHPVLVVVYDGRVDVQLLLAVATIYHEGFHNVGQGGWAGSESTRFRHPGLNLRLRYARAELARSLVRWMQGRGTAGAARYWWDQARAQAGDEAPLMDLLDRQEGSAEYVSMVGLALGAYGCDLAEPALVQRAGERLQLSWPTERVGDLVHAPDAESYMIGAAAMLMLRRQHAAGWEERVQQGSNPLDLLLDGVKPLPQAVDDGLRRHIEAADDSASPARQAAIRAEVDQYEHAAAWYLAIPAAWNDEVHFDESGGMASGTTSDQKTLRMVLSGTGVAEGRNGRVRFGSTNVLVVEETPCGPGAYGLLGLPDGPSIDIGKPELHHESPSLSIDLTSARVVKVVDGKGRTFLCLPP